MTDRPQVAMTALLTGCVLGACVVTVSPLSASAKAAACRESRLKAIGGAEVAQVGSVIFSGFDSRQRATLRLPPRNAAALLDVRLAATAQGRITVAGRRCGTGARLRFRIVRGPQALTLPPIVHGRGKNVVALQRPNRFYGLYPFFYARGTWRITLKSGSRQIGALVVGVR